MRGRLTISGDNPREEGETLPVTESDRRTALSRPLSRRDVLKLAGVTALSAAGRPLWAASPTVPPMLDQPDVTLTLTARPTEWELAPGKRIQAWTYNGAVPGEAIHVREGDRVRIILENRLPEPTTIHWHGVDVPTTMDGVPNISQPAVQPGETFIYEFEARPAGTRWYHTHFNSAQQLDLGLSAPLIIQPLTPEGVVDREYTLLLDDWVTGVPEADRPPTGRGMMDGGMMDGDEPAHNTFTINGKAFPATAPLLVKRGERVRLRLINASNMQTFVIRLGGHRLRVTHTDGNPLQRPVEVDAVPIAPAERYDVTFVADNPGRWPLFALDPAHTNGGLRTLVVYTGFESATEAPLPRRERGLSVWSYALGQGVDVLPPATGRRRSYTLTLSGGMMMRPDIWTINGRVFPDTEQLLASLNQPVSVRLSNMSMQAHPFHLHGQSFRLLRIGSQRLAAPLVKDTVDVPAHMGTVDLEFVAFNPGDWMFHCHKPMHMDGGMATLVNIG